MGLKGISTALLKRSAEVEGDGKTTRYIDKRSPDKIVKGGALAEAVFFDMSQILHKVADCTKMTDLIYNIKVYLYKFCLADHAMVLVFCDDRDNMPKPRAYTSQKRTRRPAGKTQDEDEDEEDSEFEVAAHVTHESILPSLRGILYSSERAKHMPTIIDHLVQGLSEEWDDESFTLGIARGGQWEVIKGGLHTRGYIESVVTPHSLAMLGEADTKMVHAAIKFTTHEIPMHVILASTDWDILILLLLNCTSTTAKDSWSGKEFMITRWINWVLHPNTPDPNRTGSYMLSTIVDVGRLVDDYIYDILPDDVPIKDHTDFFMDFAFLVALTGTDYNPKLASLESPTVLRYALGAIEDPDREQMLCIEFEGDIPIAVEADTGAILNNIRRCFNNQRSQKKPVLTVGEIEMAIRTSLWWVIYSLMPAFLWKEPDETMFGYNRGIPTDQVHAEFHHPEDTREDFADELKSESLLFVSEFSGEFRGRGTISYPVYY